MRSGVGVVKFRLHARIPSLSLAAAAKAVRMQRVGYPISLLMVQTALPCLFRDPGDHAL